MSLKLISICSPLFMNIFSPFEGAAEASFGAAKTRIYPQSSVLVLWGQTGCDYIPPPFRRRDIGAETQVNDKKGPHKGPRFAYTQRSEVTAVTGCKQEKDSFRARQRAMPNPQG